MHATSVKEDGAQQEENILIKIFGFHSYFTNKQSANLSKKRDTTKRLSFRIQKISKLRKKFTGRDRSISLSTQHILEREPTVLPGVQSFFEMQEKRKISGGSISIQRKNHTTQKEKIFFFLWDTRYFPSLVTVFPEIYPYSKVFCCRCVTFICDRL